MKREFGKKLIEEFFAQKVDLTHVIDTSGAYIPGHGTPTVILFGPQHAADRPLDPRRAGRPRRAITARRSSEGPRLAGNHRSDQRARERQRMDHRHRPASRSTCSILGACAAAVQRASNQLERQQESVGEQIDVDRAGADHTDRMRHSTLTGRGCQTHGLISALRHRDSVEGVRDWRSLPRRMRSFLTTEVHATDH